jgi:hypothetical protein
VFDLAPMVLEDFTPSAGDQPDSKAALLSALNVGEDAIKARNNSSDGDE